MYNSGYSQAKMGLAAKNLHRSKERSCGYYMRIVLFFSSLIQSLIIVSLVLFLVYGEPQQTVEEKRIQELEQSYARLSLENVALKAKEKNLTLQLNLTLTAKKICENTTTSLRKLANFSSLTITSLRTKLTECQMWKISVPVSPFTRGACPPPTTNKYLERHLQQAEDMQKLLKANCTEQMLITKHELENARKEWIRYQLEGIELRRAKTFLEERIEMYEKKCKEDFINSLQGIPEVTKEFLKRVDDLFSKHISFQLTCEKQTLQLEKIRANCSSLSTEVENKLQSYLDIVGSQITKTVGANAKCMTENKRLNEDTNWCIRNRSEIIEGNKKALKQNQQNHDKVVEGLLLDISRLNANKILLETSLSVKDTETKMLSEKVNELNATLAACKTVPFPRGASYGTGMSSPGMGSNFGAGTSLFDRTSRGSSGTGLGSTGLSQPNAAWSGVGSTGAGGVPSFGSTGTGTTGLDRAGSNSPAFGGVGSSGVGTSGISSGRTGYSSTGSVGTGFGSAGSSVTSLSKPGTNTAGAFPFREGDMTAQVNQLLKELHQYLKTD